MFRRDKDSRLDNEGLRRMREAIRQRIEQEEGEATDETTGTAPYRAPSSSSSTNEPYSPPPSSYEPLSREPLGREAEYSFLGTPRQERDTSSAVPPTTTENVEQDAWEPDAAPASGPIATTIAHDTTWRGTLHSTAPIRIEGDYEGQIVTEQELYIAADARVEATVRAASIIVAGQLNGQINCRERLEVLPSGRVSGQIDAGRFVVHEGASLGGQVRMRAPGDDAGTNGDNRPTLQRVR